jgi:hypothetical protein
MFVELIEVHNKMEGTPAIRPKCWNKPPSDWVKINSDGAFSVSNGEGGWGFVIRDDSTEAIAAGAGSVKHIRDALQAKAYACTQGIRAAAAECILETDSLILKQALSSDSYRFAEIGGMVLELKNLITGGFNNFLCNYVPRNCNKVAHALAAKGICSLRMMLSLGGHASVCLLFLSIVHIQIHTHLKWGGYG